VSLLTGATAKDELKAFVPALLTLQCFDSHGKKRQPLQDEAACQFFDRETHKRIYSLIADSSIGSEIMEVPRQCLLHEEEYDNGGAYFLWRIRIIFARCSIVTL
jgi:hypothetical protein